MLPPAVLVLGSGDPRPRLSFHILAPSPATGPALAGSSGQLHLCRPVPARPRKTADPYQGAI